MGSERVSNQARRTRVIVLPSNFSKSMGSERMEPWGRERHRWETERLNGAFGKSDIGSKTARVAASELGKARVSNGREHMSQFQSRTWRPTFSLTQLSRRNFRTHCRANKPLDYNRLRNSSTDIPASLTIPPIVSAFTGL